MEGVLSIQSHVVFGHAGNSSAVFPLQRMGFEVWPLHTVQFSNHTQYSQGWRGNAFKAETISDLVHGLDAIDALKGCQAVISGYLGSADQCQAVMDAVSLVKQQNPRALYVCDPVMGSPEKGCIVPSGVAEALIDKAMPLADVIVPNQFELSRFTGVTIDCLEDAIHACKVALSKGPEMVLVKHLHSLSSSRFSMMLAAGENVYLAQRPHLDFARHPVGVGDLIAALFTGGLLNGWTPMDAFQHCNNACYGILKETLRQNEWELQTIAAQEEIVSPASRFPVTCLDG
ncbi:pyridoxal kinase PdxY [Candidatus Sororendozoicomonas aggregata]|uniref:pyridoxal kinase PdxY n=1 Tax=Candidatus Sororendozoicomonas aggregata TaxID=3073239 RepID=UPI002ED3A67E